MNKAQTPESTFSALMNEICRSHNKLGLSAINWFVMLLDDVLAGFGKRLKTPWSEDQTKHLFKLGGLYSEAVIKNPYDDILGKIYQELSSNYGKKIFAQYFSPANLCMAIAKMSYNSDLLRDEKIYRVQEPASGSGIMILSFLKTVAEDNPDYLAKVSFCCIDLDMVCVKMTTTQILANAFIHQIQLGEIICMHGNSLGPPQELDTFFHASSPQFMELAREEEEEKQKKLAQEEEESVKTETIQKEIEPVFIKAKKQMSIMDFFS
jgi:N-6 DNA Methylase